MSMDETSASSTTTSVHLGREFGRCIAADDRLGRVGLLALGLDRRQPHLCNDDGFNVRRGFRRRGAADELGSIDRLALDRRPARPLSALPGVDRR